MATPQQYSPFTPTTPDAFGNTQPTVPNVSESPVLNQPNKQTTVGTQTTTASSPQKKAKQKFTLTKKTVTGALAGVVVLILVIGGGAGLYLSQTPQDTRNQASSPSGTAKISLSPSTGTIVGGSAQTVDLELDLTSTPVTLNEIAFTLTFSGNIPTDIRFSPEDLPGFTPADSSLIDTDVGKTLTVRFSTAEGKKFSAVSSKIALGKISYTAPSAGELNVQFNTSTSRAILDPSGQDILRSPGTITYSFISQSGSTPTTTISQIAGSGKTLIDNSSQSALVNESTATNSAKTLIQDSTTSGTTPTVTPIVTSSLLADGTGGTQLPTITSLPTTTKTATPTQKILTTITSIPTTTTTTSATPSASPTVTTSRSSSLPADTQSQPVSGSTSQTFSLILGGALMIALGIFLNKKSHQTSLISETGHNPE